MSRVVDDLKDDAVRIAVYGRRTGRLRDGQLAAAIAEVEKLDSPGLDDKAVVQLQVAANRALQHIAPTTLIDLRSGWDPFSNNNTETLRRNIAFISFSLLLMFASAWYTLQYNGAAAEIAGLESIGEEDVEERIGEIIRRLRVAEAKIGEINSATTQTDDNEIYFTMVDQLRDYDQRVVRYSTFASNFLLLSDNPISMSWQLAQPWLQPVPLPKDLKQLPQCPPRKPGEGSTPTAATAASDAQTTDAQLQTGDSAVKTEDQFSVMYVDYYYDSMRILCAAEITTTPFDIPPMEQYAVRTKDRINVLALWVLPCLYGALGATIYYMRRVLDPTLKDPHVSRIIHRIALGAFSGIIIAWFWAPSNRVDFANVGLNLFGAAFLLGFSVDIFFAFMDRLVQVIQRWIRGIGVANRVEE